MYGSLTPRNVANNAINPNGVASTTITLTVTATVAGDVGIVGIVTKTGAAVTITPPSGWQQVTFRSQTGIIPSAGIYINPAMPAGTTSWVFTVATTGANVNQVAAAYACYDQSTFAPFTGDGANSNDATGTGTITALATTALGKSSDLIVWVGASGGTATASPTNPTGTGTWTSLGSGFASGLGIRMSAQLGPAAGSTATASGSTFTNSNVSLAASTAVIAGITLHRGNGFFALMDA